MFFFQAEDGIRDWSVTGVQTCALPILVRDPQSVGRLLRHTTDRLRVTNHAAWSSPSVRSEERRVGNEGWCWRLVKCMLTAIRLLLTFGIRLCLLLRS